MRGPLNLSAFICVHLRFSKKAVQRVMLDGEELLQFDNSLAGNGVTLAGGYEARGTVSSSSLAVAGTRVRRKTA